MQTVDWDVLRLQYELLHEDPHDLAIENQLSPVVVDRAIRKGGWQRMAFKDVSESFNEILDVEEIDDTVLDKVERRVKILHALKRAALNPRVISLEAAIVSKAREVVASIKSDDPLAPTKLGHLSKIAQEMKQVSGPADEGKDDARISVNIMNRA